MNAIVDLLIYAAAMDLYRRTNMRVNATPRLSSKQTYAMLRVVDWSARPALLNLEGV